MPSSDLAYTPAAWSSFLSAEVGASAALTGLIFVAVSINLSRIISLGQSVARAAKALATLVGTLFAASFCLVPGQSTRALGLELTLLGAFFWLAATLLQREAIHNNTYIHRNHKIFQVLLAQGAQIPLVICGVSLLCIRGGGLYWLLASVLTSFACAMVDAWVLLIEIQR